MVVFTATFEEELEQLRRVRALRIDERALVVERMTRTEGTPYEELEVPGARMFDREAAHGDAIDGVDPRGQVVAPCPVVGRGSRRDLDREVGRKALDDTARVRLRAAGHVAVARDDHEQARVAQLAARSTSCSRRPSNAGQVHSRSTYRRPAAPSMSRFASTAASASARSSRS